MHAFKNGIKRITVAGASPSPHAEPPFTILSRHRLNGSGPETWVVRGWQDPMRHYFDGVGIELHDVIDLDLEEGFVELLRSSRPNTSHRS